MPFPTALLLTLATGFAAAAAARSELRLSPRQALLTRSFFAYALFAAFVMTPGAVYFYLFHGDWFLLYAVNVATIPSALALVGFAAQVAVGALGFFLGAHLVRAGRDNIARVAAGLLGLLGVGAIPLAGDRLAKVGSYAQFHGAFGLTPLMDSVVMHGMILVYMVVAVGLAFLLVRIRQAGH